MTDEKYQSIAAGAHAAAGQLIAGMHEHTYAGGGGNGSPIISGVLVAVLDYAMLSDKTDDDIKAMIANICNEMLPQLRMEAACAGQAASRA
jgi:hypothetical protein